MKNAVHFLLAFVGVLVFTASCSTNSTFRSSNSTFQPEVKTLQVKIDTGTCGVVLSASVANAASNKPIDLFFEIAGDESGKTIKEGPVNVTRDGTYSLALAYNLPQNSSYDYRAVIEYTGSNAGASNAGTDMGELIQFTMPQCGSYPTTYRALSQSEIGLLQQEFQSMNPGTKATIDKYGFFGFLSSTQVNYHPAYVVPDEEQALQIAMNMLNSNSKFSGVTPLTVPDIRRTLRLGSDGPWRIEYKQQYYKGLRVAELYSYPICLWVDGSVSAIMGHYYSSIYIPDYENVSQQEALNSLIGHVLTYYDFGGHPVNVTLTQEDLSSVQPIKSIVPHETDKGLSLRVCWEFPIDGGWWTAYIDTITGELIRVDQNFVT
jgi:hypothetical protein